MPSIPFTPDTTPAPRNQGSDLDRLIAERQESWIMWHKVRQGRKRGSRGWWRAYARERAAVMLLDSAYRIRAIERRP